WYYDSLSCCASVLIFFFSSRRRHTRWPREWSSDVCSSDLSTCTWPGRKETPRGSSTCRATAEPSAAGRPQLRSTSCAPSCHEVRSEERRVGKECRSRWSA